MSTHEDTRIEIEKILTTAFSPLELQVIDDSAHHRGHAEALAHQSAGHFRVIMKSAQFDGVNQVKRHRMVYEKLGPMMEQRIHALSLNLSASDE